MSKRQGVEQATVTAILQFLHAHHIPAWRMNTGATKIGGRFLRFGVVGMADIIGILTLSGARGQFVAVEVKAGIRKPTAAQVDFLARVNAAGGHGFVARSVADVQQALGL